MLDSQTAISADRTLLPATLDALIIGAGVAGLYQLHQLRAEGLKVRAVDTADGHTLIQISTDADTAPEMEILSSVHTAFAAGDFVL